MYEGGNQRGFTLLGILIAVVIICILAAGGLQVYTGVGGTAPTYDPDTVRGGLDITVLKTRLRSLAMEQALEYSLRQRYITNLQELLNRALGVGYYPNAQDPVPAISMFDLKMEVTSTGFVIKAVPNTLAGAPRNSPTYVIDNSMQVYEE
jgi:prepilin-type N-terminal cleavage/methylation domain-containing protein